MDEKYKKVRKMYLVCEHCGDSNEKVSMRNTYKTILCNKCYFRVIKGYLEPKNEEEEQKEEEQIIHNNELNFEPSYDIPKFNEDGKIMCNECGRFFSCLGRHLNYAHNMSTSEYKKKYKYNRKVKLTSKDYSDFCRERMANIDMEKQVKRIFHIKRKKEQELLNQINMDDYKL